MDKPKTKQEMFVEYYVP